MEIQEMERIVEKYSTILLRVAIHQVGNRVEAEDIVQDVFLKCLYNAPSFNDDQHAQAWLIRVTINASKDNLRNWWKRRRSEFPRQEKEAKQEEFPNLLYIVKKLPQNYRSAIYLFYYEGFSVAQIAEIYKVKDATVSSWLHRGRLKLKEFMEGEDFYEEKGLL